MRWDVKTQFAEWVTGTILVFIPSLYARGEPEPTVTAGDTLVIEYPHGVPEGGTVDEADANRLQVTLTRAKTKWSVRRARPAEREHAGIEVPGMPTQIWVVDDQLTD